MRRTFGMSYKEREAHRLARKSQIANEKQAKADTLTRLMDFVLTIEDAFKPEADRLFAQVVDGWKKSHKLVMENLMPSTPGRVNYSNTYNKVRTVITGRDFDADPIPEFTGSKYVNHYSSRYSDAYVTYVNQTERPRELKKSFDTTQHAFIITRNLYDNAKLLAHAEKEAADIVESNKAKLLNAVAQYLGEFQTVEVKGKDFVKAHAKGFQGEFYIITDKGPRLFECRAITASGPIVSFHWRFIAHVKAWSGKGVK